MTLARLIEMVPPPFHAIYTGNDQAWGEIQQRMGIRLPCLSKEYCMVYGSGFFRANNRLFIHNPFDPAYEATIRCDCENYNILRTDSPEYYPYPIFPERDGLFPIGVGSGGISIYLQLGNSADDYTVIFDDRNSLFREFPGLTFFEFLLNFLSNKLEQIPYFSGRIDFVPQKMVP